MIVMIKETDGDSYEKCCSLNQNLTFDYIKKNFLCSFEVRKLYFFVLKIIYFIYKKIFLYSFIKYKSKIFSFAKQN